MGTFLIVLAAAVATIVVVLTIIGYINNIFSIAERINLGGHHAPPRLHWRRGHIRILHTGRRCYVRPHEVGHPEIGVIAQTRVIKDAAAQVVET